MTLSSSILLHFFFLVFFLLIPPPLISTLFPYTTLFRSKIAVTQPVDMLPGDHIALVVENDLKSAELIRVRSEEHTSELQSRRDLVCRLLLEKKKKKRAIETHRDNLHCTDQAKLDVMRRV